MMEATKSESSRTSAAATLMAAAEAAGFPLGQPAPAAPPDVALAPLPSVSAAPVQPATSHVGHYGATVVASALQRVPVMNNIPLNPRRKPRRGLLRRLGHTLDSFVDATANWFHGSVPHRMAYVRGLSTDPSLTGRFDRFMMRLYCTLLFALFASAAFVIASGALLPVK